MSCRESGGFKHEYRWDRCDSIDGTIRTRWVHGWRIIVRGDASRAWKDRNSFELINRDDTPSAVVIRRNNISSVSAAMTQALAVVHAMRGLNLGTREKRRP